ncbi:DUF3289 family protein [Vibrio parahaemolyticus]|nr:DUF3289 family protein [Vibrio parahaemolyticus]
MASQHRISLGTDTSQPLQLGDGIELGDGIIINQAPASSLASSVGTGTHPSASQHTATSSPFQQNISSVHETTFDEWKPVSGAFPRLVFETKNKMDTFYNPNFPDDCPPDMKHGDQVKDVIEAYGFMQPFKQSEYSSPREGYTLQGENQFTLPASEHFKRMRNLGDYFSNPMFQTGTSNAFWEMVDKFERNEGGYYDHFALSRALQDHETTAIFHAALLKCLGEHQQSGVLNSDIISLTSQYMASSKGASLPQFQVRDGLIPKEDLLNGTVLAVHGIWSMKVYADYLEYKGNQIRGTFRYEIQDHFGLDPKDVNHTMQNGLFKQFEHLEGFRSWYLLQHYTGYDYKPFITKIEFNL